MTERDLSQRLEELAIKIEEIADSDLPNWPFELQTVAIELRKLSNEKYTVGHTSWEDVKKVAKNPTKKFPF